LFLVLYLSRN